METIFLAIASILLTFAVFINIADYSLFTYKRNAISKAMDYAVTAGVQQVNSEESREGIAGGFTENTGRVVLEGIKIDIDSAAKTFLTILYKNCNLGVLDINKNLLVCATSTRDNKLSYIIKANQEIIAEGTADKPSSVEEKINRAIGQYWSDSEDNSRIYINGNANTNMLENGTYLFAFIKNIEITGIYSHRYISLSSFAGAKLERHIQN